VSSYLLLYMIKNFSLKVYYKFDLLYIYCIKSCIYLSVVKIENDFQTLHGNIFHLFFLFSSIDNGL